MKIFDNNICWLTFTHTDCADVWPIYFHQMDKFLPIEIERYLALDKISSLFNYDVKPIIYDDRNPYPLRLYTTLHNLQKYDYIIFDHEDMFLYGHPDLEELAIYYQVLTTMKYDYIRLIKGGDAIYSQSKESQSLFCFDKSSSWIFSIQPSFWRRERLMDILQQNLLANIWELEVLSQQVVREQNLLAAFSHRSGKRRGLYHFDNDVYPYVATALNKGKWNYSEYGSELEPILKYFEIDPRVRGCF